MANDVFPRNNLNADAVPWGRAIEAATVNNKVLLESALAILQGNNRANAGQMGIAGRQIDQLSAQTAELDSRLTRTQEMRTVAITTSGTGTWATAVSSILVPGTGEDRNAMLSVFGPVSSSGNMAGPFVTVRFNNKIVYRNGVGASGGMVPADWANSLTATFSAMVPAAGAMLTITLQGSSFVSGAQTASINFPGVTTLFTDRAIV